MAKKSKSKLVAIAALKPEAVASRRWDADKSDTEEWYYDEPVKDVTKRVKDFPPNNLDLSDAWVVAIVKSNLSRDDRGTRWPAVFSVKGELRAKYVHKGQAAKLYDSEDGNFKYALLFGEHNMFGEEGASEGLPGRRRSQLKDVDAVSLGLMAQVQNSKYVAPKAKTATPTRTKVAKTTKTKTTKRAVPGTTRQTRQAKNTGNEEEDSEDEEDDPISDEKESAVDPMSPTLSDEKESAEDRVSPTLARLRTSKNARKSASKKRKAEVVAETPSKKRAIEANVTPTKSSPIAGDDWAKSKTPSKSTEAVMLRDLLRKPNPQEKKLETELLSSQKANQDLIKQNAALRKQADDWKEAALLSRPTMAFLLRSLRGSQNGLKEVIQQVASYDLSNDERASLVRVVEKNDNMTQLTKDKMPMFYQRIYLDTDIAFNAWYEEIEETAHDSIDMSHLESPAEENMRVQQGSTAASASPKTTETGQGAVDIDRKTAEQRHTAAPVPQFTPVNQSSRLPPLAPQDLQPPPKWDLASTQLQQASQQAPKSIFGGGEVQGDLFDPFDGKDRPFDGQYPEAPYEAT